MSSAVWDRSAPSSRTCFDLVRFGLSFATGVLLIGIAATSVGAFDVQRMSVASDGTEGDGNSTTNAVSADGRVVAFVSTSDNLAGPDANLLLDVYVRDRATGTTERASVGPNGEDANGQSATPVLSGDGRFVAFASTAGNLVAGDDNGRFDVFVRDRASGVTERVSLASDGSQATADSVAPAISADGRYVAFASAAPLVPDDTNDTFDVYVRDLVAQTTTRVSVASDGTQSNNLSLAPRISADGSVVVFHSFASNLVAGDTNNVPDVFAHDMSSGSTARMSVSSTGTQGTQQSVGAQVSGDGRYVAFDSDASNLVTGDLNGRTDVFVHDRVSGATERVSLSSTGTEGNNRSGFVDPPSLSFDGRYVAFTTGANNLVPNDTNNRVDVVLRDRQLQTTVRVNVAADGTEADGSSTLWANVSADGSVVVYASSATNLVPDDTNFLSDVFAWIDACGNGTVDLGETCDDGNRVDGDCCSASCQAEAAGGACDDGDLCTQSDTCDGAGFCTGADPVVCDDDGGQCGSPASCDPATGACVAGDPAAAGTPCDDGNLCTQSDACDGAGSCSGADPVVCDDSGGQCGTPASCDPATGACVAGEPAAAGTPCTDGNLCTQSDTCDGAGSCVGADPVVCEAGGSGQCGSAASCDPATGACVGGPSPDGTACDDGDPCTVQDSCVAGVCEPGGFDPAACVSSFQCYDAVSWHRPFWWFGSGRLRLDDLFESATFNFGGTTRVCSALSLPGEQDADRLACVRLRRTSGRDTTRTVQVDNALGALTLRVGQARELCLPADASQLPADPGLDAFKCYEAEVKYKTPRFVPVSVKLSDEFGTGTVDVVGPDMVCNPASVAGGGVEHEGAHLVCYSIQERRVWGRYPDVFRPRTTKVVSALGSEIVSLISRQHLCVPSTVDLR